MPLYHGECPEEISNGLFDPMKYIKMPTVDFVQIISRVCTPTTEEAFALNWYPKVDTGMKNFAF